MCSSDLLCNLVSHEIRSLAKTAKILSECGREVRRFFDFPRAVLLQHFDWAFTSLQFSVSVWNTVLVLVVLYFKPNFFLLFVHKVEIFILVVEFGGWSSEGKW